MDGFHLTAAAQSDEANNKLLGYAPQAIGEIWRSGMFTHILIEADGAARRPLKAPAGHEPVISPETSMLIAVIGLDGIGVPLTKERVFRPEQYSLLTTLPMGQTITTESVCAVLTHPEGIMKGCPKRARRFVFLNKAETPNRQTAGRKVGRFLFQNARNQINDVLMGSLNNEKAGIAHLFSPVALEKL
jgi:probable selenium-dependent hydroxylase accessory protein YqeC